MKKSEISKIKDHILKKVNIVKLVQNYGIELISETGGRYKSRCPFHEEKTASMKIYPETNTYFCYGCSSGHSVIDFIMEKEGMSFLEVIHRFRENVDITSKKFLLEEIHKKLNDDKINIVKYANAFKYRIGITLREIVKKDIEKAPFVDNCFRDMDLYFSDVENMTEERVDYLVDQIMERVSDGS